ncbi:hypothetical protein JCM11641_007981 [Rhodosporidiobolus odoratus]
MSDVFSPRAQRAMSENLETSTFGRLLPSHSGSGTPEARFQRPGSAPAVLKEQSPRPRARNAPIDSDEDLLERVREGFRRDRSSPLVGSQDTNSSSDSNVDSVDFISSESNVSSEDDNLHETKINEVDASLSRIRDMAASGLNSFCHPPVLDKLCEQVKATHDFREDKDGNWELMVEEDGAFQAFVDGIATLPEAEGSMDRLRKATGGLDDLVICQVTYECTALVVHYANLVNAAAGGFFYLSSATGRQAFFDTFFPLIDHFFRKGGEALIALPIGELSESALESLRSWQATYAELYPREQQAIKFFFVSDHDRDQLYHVKEFFAIAPGGACVYGVPTANMNASRVGTKVIKVKGVKDQRHAAKSTEILRLNLYDYNLEQAIIKIITDLGSFWYRVHRRGHIFYNVLALDWYLGAKSMPRNLDNIRNTKRAAVLRAAYDLLNDAAPDPSDQIQQISVALAGRDQADDSSDDITSGLDEPIVLLHPTPAKRRTKLKKTHKKKLKEVKDRYSNRRNDEENLAIANMNAEIIKELKESITDPDLAEALDRLGERSSYQSRRGGGSAGEDNDDDDDDDSAGGDIPPPPPASDDSDDQSGNASSRGDPDGNAGEDEGFDGGDGNTADDEGGSAAAAEPAVAPDDAASKPSSMKKRVRKPPSATYTRLQLSDTCDFCGRTRADQAAAGLKKTSMASITRFGQHTACQACNGRLRNGASEIIDFDAALKWCQHKGHKGLAKKTGDVCKVCKRDRDSFGRTSCMLSFQQLKGRPKTLCKTCAYHLRTPEGKKIKSWKQARKHVKLKRKLV